MAVIRRELQFVRRFDHEAARWSGEAPRWGFDASRYRQLNGTFIVLCGEPARS